MIALLVLAGLLLLGFVMVQILLPKTATIPPRIFKQRSILSGFFATVCIGSEMMIFSKSDESSKNEPGLANTRQRITFPSGSKPFKESRLSNQVFAYFLSSSPSSSVRWWRVLLPIVSAITHLL